MKIVQIAKNYPFSVAVIVIIWILSLIPIPETPLSDVKMIDKWTHIVMYGGLSLVICYEYMKTHQSVQKEKFLLLDWLAPVLMGGLLELLQAYCTGGNRSGDWLDFFANGLGATLGCLVGILLAVCLSKRRKDI